MPRTEAGKRLLADLLRVASAIEAEAVAAERERIRAAVEARVRKWAQPAVLSAILGEQADDLPLRNEDAGLDVARLALALDAWWATAGANPITGVNAVRAAEWIALEYASIVNPEAER